MDLPPPTTIPQCDLEFVQVYITLITLASIDIYFSLLFHVTAVIRYLHTLCFRLHIPRSIRYVSMRLSTLRNTETAT